MLLGDVAASGARFMARFPGAGLAQDLFGRLSGSSSLAFQSQAQDGRFVLPDSGLILHYPVPGALRISEWVAQHGTTLPVYPTQIYESVGQLVLFCALLYARRYRRFHGHIFALWLMCYAVLRTTVELFRGDTERGTLHGLLESLGAVRLADAVPLEAWYNISTSQFISLCMFTFGATLLYRRIRQSVSCRAWDRLPAPREAARLIGKRVLGTLAGAHGVRVREVIHEESGREGRYLGQVRRQAGRHQRRHEVRHAHHVGQRGDVPGV
ncbi:prolipoprotein diacylglyceryl transferase family protein [Cystobacter fuscus]